MKSDRAVDTNVNNGTVTVQFEDEIAIVEISNPRSRNSITSSMRRQLVEIFDKLSTDRIALAVVLTGSGAHFSSGMDIKEITASNANAIADDLALVERRISAAPMPTIAAIDGYCLGGGAQLALACDIRIASARSFVAITPGKLGIVYPAESISRLTSLVGASAAKWMLFSGDPVTPEVALRLGLVQQVTSDEDLRPAAMELARTICSRSPISVTAAKAMITASTRSLGEVQEVERFWRSLPNADVEIGINSFINKVRPAFPRNKLP
ncbi:enoyl-CoA hydratase/isomerase family protein [Rhodococcoides fascians]|uniref:enoyl-CoA hydratase/isomerase family protein n=1 Tax=Rhodococcoides fascians TaxID=1828 RepID=UPI0009B88AAE|nr:enoyl-CoA hydratase/isomerase family protein [Rhodococcus fascians]